MRGIWAFLTAGDSLIVTKLDGWARTTRDPLTFNPPKLRARPRSEFILQSPSPDSGNWEYFRNNPENSACAGADRREYGTLEISPRPKRPRLVAFAR